MAPKRPPVAAGVPKAGLGAAAGAPNREVLCCPKPPPGASPVVFKEPAGTPKPPPTPVVDMEPKVGGPPTVAAPGRQGGTNSYRNLIIQ